MGRLICEQILKTSFNKAPNIYLFSSVQDDYNIFDNLLHVDIDNFNKSNPNIDIYDALESGSANTTSANTATHLI